MCSTRGMTCLPRASLVSALFILACSPFGLLACDDDPFSLGRGSRGAGSTGSSGAAGPAAENEIQPALEACCEEDGTFDDSNPDCTDFIDRYGLDAPDFCTFPWPADQTATPAAPFADPICDLDCTGLTPNSIVGCMDGPVSGSFAYDGGDFDLTKKDGQPFSWTLNYTLQDPREGSVIYRYEFIIAGDGNPAPGTYPLGPSGVSFVQGGRYTRSGGEAGELYSYKSEDVAPDGQISFFQIPQEVGDTVVGAYDYSADTVRSFTAPSVDGTAVGTTRFQACFAVVTTP